MFVFINKNYTFWLFIFLSERIHFDKNTPQNFEAKL